MSMSNASRSADINGTKRSQDKHLWPMVHAMQRPITLDRPTEKRWKMGKYLKNILTCHVVLCCHGINRLYEQRIDAVESLEGWRRARRIKGRKKEKKERKR